MIEITSKNNQVYKLFQKLQTKKYRDKQELYLIEGENLIQEALSEGAIIQKTVISRSCAHRLKDTAEKLNGDVFVVEDSLFKNIAQTKTSQKACRLPGGYCRKRWPGEFCGFRQASGSGQYRNDNTHRRRGRI